MPSVPAPSSPLYDEAGPLVYRRCLRMLNNHEASLDVTQWVFLRAVEIGFEVRSPAESLSWLYQAATKRCLTIMRTERTRRRIRGQHKPELVQQTPSPEGQTIHRDLLLQALDAVDDQTGHIALLTWFQGLSNLRAAEICGVSTRSVLRARRRFETVLEELNTGNEP